MTAGLLLILEESGFRPCNWALRERERVRMCVRVLAAVAIFSALTTVPLQRRSTPR
jgi:hypothetical protein